MRFKFRSLTLRVTSLLLLSLSSPQIQASMDKSWFVMGQHTDKEKQTHLYQSWVKSGHTKLYGIHTYQLQDFGRSFSYDGAVEREFQDELTRRSGDDVITILIPAFGSGRSVLDTLSGHETATVIANEIQSSGYQQLKQLARTYNVDLRRVKKLPGDIMEQLDTLKPQSVDLVYVTNLIHFFSPQQIETFLTKLKRVIKEDGKIFISWRGFPDEDPDSDVKMSTGHKQKLIQSKLLKSLGLPFPRFIRESDFGASEWGLDYYHAKNSDIIFHGRRTGFNCISQAVSELTSVTLQNLQKEVIANLGEYRHVKVSAFSPLKYMPVSNHVVFQVNPEYDDQEHEAIISYEEMIRARSLKISKKKGLNKRNHSVAPSKHSRNKKSGKFFVDEFSVSDLGSIKIKGAEFTVYRNEHMNMGHFETFVKYCNFNTDDFENLGEDSDHAHFKVKESSKVDLVHYANLMFLMRKSGNTPFDFVGSMDKFEDWFNKN